MMMNMKKLLQYALVAGCLVCNSGRVLADNTLSGNQTDKTSTEYIISLYKKIDFCAGSRLSPEVFKTAYKGYANLRKAGKLNSDKELLTICDFSISANYYRFWVIDLQQHKVLFNTFVAHGQGSGDEFATAFSNKENSHQSSLGFYVTGETYNGEHGTSLRLDGMDNGYNSAALDRGIVVHGANYISKTFIEGNKRLGRSWGCPALCSELAPQVIDAIKDGTCLFIYYPDQNYLASSFWLNKKAVANPGDAHDDAKFMLQPPGQPDGNEVAQLKK
jgi:hypothetical protein